MEGTGHHTKAQPLIFLMLKLSFQNKQLLKSLKTYLKSNGIFKIEHLFFSPGDMHVFVFNTCLTCT